MKVYGIIDNIGVAVVVISIVCLITYVYTDIIKRENKLKKLKILSKDDASGIIFGFLKKKLVCSVENDEGHIAVFGGTGLGKTAALLIPSLRKWLGTAFIIDISGDICKNANMRKKLVYEPENRKTIPYNVFAEIDQQVDDDEKYELLEQLAFILMPDAKKTSNEAAEFFNTEGRKILTSAFICYYFIGIDFVNICDMIMSMSWSELLNDIAGYERQKANQYIASFMGASEQNNAGCKQAVDKAIKLFATNEKIKKNIRRPNKKEQSICPKTLEKVSVFVIIQDNKLKLYAPLLQLITAQSLEYFSKRSSKNKKTILFCLDEFVSLGKMEITEALRKLRKKHIRIMMLTQSMADLDLVYGRDERMAMMNNYTYKVVLGCDDTDTQTYFAKLIGQKSIKKNSKSTNSRQTTHTEAEAKDWIIDPADLGRLGDSLILLSPDGYLKLHKNFYYKN